jgi:hypothetical protein
VLVREPRRLAARERAMTRIWSRRAAAERPGARAPAHRAVARFSPFTKRLTRSARALRLPLLATRETIALPTTRRAETAKDDGGLRHGLAAPRSEAS